MHWDQLLVQGFPLLFHGVIGADMREERSPSFFNPAEAAMVKYYVDKLIDKGAVKDAEIGIIAPYRKQVLARTHKGDKNVSLPIAVRVPIALQ